MKPKDVHEIIIRLRAMGYEKEVPTKVLENEISNYVGLDKYKLKYALETLIRLGYFSWAGINTLEIGENNGKM